MTSKVFEFLNDSGGSNFTETAPRPPVPGEENELQSNGGMSTRSSGSHRSNKSYSSSKSATSAKGDVNHSPAATPRKSNLEKGDVTITSHLQGFDNEDVNAPLGFEPEGSVAYSPPYSENSTPPHLKWAENLNHLLTDSEGVALFKDFLEQEQGGADELQFWFACQGLKQKADTDDVSSIVKVIYKTYVRVDKVKCISKETKKEITDKITQKVKIDHCIFDAAQAEVENHLRTVSYAAFLNSDLYVQYVNNYAESPKSSHSSGSNSARPVSQSGLLPVLHEDKELAAEDYRTMGEPLLKMPGGRRLDFPRRIEPAPGCYPFNSRSAQYPAYVSYAPVSAQDSELQSLSSDALTDDTVSLTDTSSVDGNMTYNRKRIRKIMKNNALHNREYRTGLHTQIIPRTERAPKDRNIAETDPARFAQLLIEKLEKEVEERDAVAKVEERLKTLNQGEAVEEEINVSYAKNTTTTSIIPLMSQSGMEEETAESILDQHCSRIWDNSLHHTPSRSPGRQSPRTKSPDRTFARPKTKVVPPSAMGASSTPATMNTSFPRSYRSKKDPILSKSYDSGMGEEPMVVRGETHRSDASSNIDSGISMMYEAESTRVVPNWNNPSSEKVMKWIMQSEKITGESGSASVDTDRSSSHKTRSHRYASASATSQQHKGSSSKKTGTYTSSRSTSVERSGMHTWSVAGATPILPNQPFAQDSNMPLPTPPNPTTQLEEAKRRLEDQSRAAGPVKSKSFAGVPSKDKSRIVPGAGMPPLPAQMSSVKTVPSDLDTTTTSLDYSQPPKTSSGGASNAPSDSTVVGIYYDQEPIPYRFNLSGRAITLAQVRAITKKGSYKYFFKRHSDEFGDGGAVWEEIKDDGHILPMWDGKVVARLQKVD
ncbi:hypothetical protein BaRGS_00026443 [Batillaria attramentaria]|uniref:Axin n=1 Tax=Batillaria attramentaria TaxID=370345 RepID=A0ABD0K4H4_9CAEN